jgi:heat shock protein HspQ
VFGGNIPVLASAFIQSIIGIGSKTRHAMAAGNAKFFPGQIVHHKRFDYRGVIIDVDPVFQGTDEWYEKVARSRPPKDEPWYRVLVHGNPVETDVAERNLEEDDSGQAIDHPYVQQIFSELQDGKYIRHRPH